MEALVTGTRTIRTRRDRSDRIELDSYLRGLGVADEVVRAVLIAEIMPGPPGPCGDKPAISRLRRLVAMRSAEALGRDCPQDACEEADAILAFALSGAIRRYPEALLDPCGQDARSARQITSGPPTIQPREQAGLMPVQPLRPASFLSLLAAVWRSLARGVTTFVRNAWRCP